ncbi:hypothetical protein SETIT_9G176000v2 [Setaria italica]|uniref:Factor of DNA methylation 1-5/IDN2 domain-containing protein n=2 Tax=Setaria italica TaxID=4555 RepID=A0A368SHV7_SETIT|nr:uncharacterized protein LOC101767060 [Setaria italica]RCV41951.1 hypothetical protein SETIT_9G176000v2 [Setaria italica]
MIANLSEKDEVLEHAVYVSNTLTMKYMITKDKLSEATGELIKELKKMKGIQSIIGVKQAGSVSQRLQAERNRRWGLEEQAELLCSEWQKEISRQYSDWHPFKPTIVNGVLEEVVMEDDEKLVAWKEDWGIEVHNAVVQALVELNECNPSGRYPVHVLWNFSENRKASVARAVKHLMKLWKADMGKYMAQGDRRTRPRTVICDKAPQITANCKKTNMREARSLMHAVGGSTLAPLMTVKETEMENGATMSEVCSELKKMIDKMTMELKKRDDELQDAQFLNCHLIKEEREMHDNLSKAKRSLFKGLREIAGSLSVIGVKQMGQLDKEVFLNACKLKGAKDHLEATRVCLQWQYEISRPEWYPFKTTYTEGHAKALVELKLKEYNRYGHGRFPVPVLWNFSESREASIAEAVVHLAKLWRANKGKYVST